MSEVIIPDLNAIVRSFIEEELKDKAEEYVKRQAIAWAKSIGGPATVIDNLEIETEMKEASMDIPSATLKIERQKLIFHVPKVTWSTHTVAKIAVPEVRMKRKRVGDHHHVKTRWKTKHIGLGVKTKVPEVVHYTTPAYADVPEVYTRMQEIKTDMPTVEMIPNTYEIDTPSITAGSSKVSTMVPHIKKVKVDIAGAIKDFVPGGSFISELLDLIQEAQEFKDKLRKKVENAIESTLSESIKAVDSALTKVEEQVDKIEEKYLSLIRELEDKAGDHKAEISNLSKQMEEKIKPILKQINGYEKILDDIEDAKSKAYSIFDSFSFKITL